MEFHTIFDEKDNKQITKCPPAGFNAYEYNLLTTVNLLFKFFSQNNFATWFAHEFIEYDASRIDIFFVRQFS